MTRQSARQSKHGTGELVMREILLEEKTWKLFAISTALTVFGVN